jgi:hypothetical protein
MVPARASPILAGDGPCQGQPDFGEWRQRHAEQDELEQHDHRQMGDVKEVRGIAEITPKRAMT